MLMKWLAKMCFPRSQPHDQLRKFNVLLGAVIVGVLTAAVLGLGFYYFNRRSLSGH